MVQKNYFSLLAKIKGIETRAIFQQLSDDENLRLTISGSDNPNFPIPFAM
jgi:hypothetical protein